MTTKPHTGDVWSCWCSERLRVPGAFTDALYADCLLVHDLGCLADRGLQPAPGALDYIEEMRPGAIARAEGFLRDGQSHTAPSEPTPRPTDDAIGPNKGAKP